MDVDGGAAAPHAAVDALAQEEVDLQEGPSGGAGVSISAMIPAESITFPEENTMIDKYCLQ